MCKRLPLLAIAGDEEFLKETSIIAVCKRHKRVLKINEDYNLMHTEYAAIVLDMSGLCCPGFDEWEREFLYTQGEYMTQEEYDKAWRQEFELCQNSWGWLIYPSEEELAEYRLEGSSVGGEGDSQESDHRGEKYFKVYPNPVFVKVSGSATKDDIVDALLDIDAGQKWRDDVSYGNIEYYETSLEEAREHGWFVEEEEWQG